MFHKCNVCDCASSATFFVIVFDDHTDVLEKTMKVTVRSLPNKNGVTVKINVILLKISSSEFIFSKNSRVGFHRCVFRRHCAPRSCYQ